MAIWQRCEKSVFYRRVQSRDPEIYNQAYVDPVDLILIRTIPWYSDKVTILKWQILEMEVGIFDDLEPGKAALILAWAERVSAEMDGGISRRQKETLLEDLDVDSHARDILLDAVLNFVDASPAEATALVQHKIPRSVQAIEGFLFHWGVGPC